MSNQNATVNRVTLLESIEAAKRSLNIAIAFNWHAMRPPIPFYLTTIDCLYDKAIIEAAELEAWGDGP